MTNIEIKIFLLNLAIISIAYFIVYPRVAGSNINKLFIFDILVSGIPLIIVGSTYWETGQEFNAIFITLNWFWFTLITYAIIEIPFSIWYFKKNEIVILERLSDIVIEKTQEIQYFTTSTTKLVVMSICTFGIYEFYWFYKNWVEIKKLEEPKIMPFWRGFFSPIFAYDLFERIQQSINHQNISISVYAGISAISYFTLNILWRLPDPYWLLSMMTFIPLIPANIAATKVNRNIDPNYMQNKSIKGCNWLALGIGLPLLFSTTILSTPTFSSYLEAEELFEKCKFNESQRMYQIAIKHASDSPFFGFYEYEIRSSYGLMLNKLIKDGNPELISVSRKQFEWVLAYLENNSEIFTTKALALFNLANTYQQEAVYTDVDEEYYLLLEKAYSIYKQSAQELEKNQDWQNLAIISYNLGKTAEWYGDLPEAISWLKKAVALDEKYGSTMTLKKALRI